MIYYINRFLAFCVDLFLVGILGAISGFLVDIFDVQNILGDWIFYIQIILYLAKDGYSSNGSIGKKLFRLKLVFNSKEYQFLKIVIRNISLVFWPLEGILVLIFKRRIGDFIMGANVIENKDDDVS